MIVDYGGATGRSVSAARLAPPPGFEGMADGTARSPTLPRPDGALVHRGARRPSDVPADVLRRLAQGAPSANHMEQMAFDHGDLLSVVLPEAADRADELRTPAFLARLRAGAIVAWDLLGEDLFEAARSWPSDTARGWAAFAVPFAGGGPERCAALALEFAADAHFAVREWAWLGLRPVVAADPERMVRFLTDHTGDHDPRVRRFCSEATRPRGVWSSHLKLLKARPELGLPVLEPLATAPEKYVRDSVGNWLNDAGRTRPDWVVSVTADWAARHGDAARYVVRRGTRSLPGLVPSADPDDLPFGADAGPY